MPPPQVALAVGYSVIVYPCLSLLPFGVFVLEPCFVVSCEYLAEVGIACCFTIIVLCLCHICVLFVVP